MTTPPEPAPPIAGPGIEVTEPLALLLSYLDWYREAVRRKTTGLSEAQLRDPLQPMGWSPLGLVKHLGWVERRWMRWGFAGEDVAAYPPGGRAAEWRLSAAESTASVLSTYADEIARSKALADGVPFDRTAELGGRFSSADQAPTLGQILFHLLQEYARHVGHLDIARELIDGVTGE